MAAPSDRHHLNSNHHMSEFQVVTLTRFSALPLSRYSGLHEPTLRLLIVLRKANSDGRGGGERAARTGYHVRRSVRRLGPCTSMTRGFLDPMTCHNLISSASDAGKCRLPPLSLRHFWVKVVSGVISFILTTGISEPAFNTLAAALRTPVNEMDSMLTTNHAVSPERREGSYLFRVSTGFISR